MEDFLKKFWKRLKSWWGVLFTLATGHFGETVWHKLGDFDLAQSLLGWFGVSTDMVLSFLFGPIFSLIVASIGAFGMVVFEKPDFKTKHPNAQLAGASIFVIFASLIGGSFVFEQLIQTPKFSEVAAFYIRGHQHRHLMPEQKSCLAQNLTSKKKEFSLLIVTAVSGTEPESYAYDFSKVFETVGIRELTTYDAMPINDDDSGIFVGFVDPKHPSTQGTDLESILKKCGVFPKTTNFLVDQSNFTPPPDFDLFIASN
jgi:hypothetical protein